ncbi:hypothetical protein WJX82_004787 [Trebouxia sp. C0006]
MMLNQKVSVLEQIGSANQSISPRSSTSSLLVLLTCAQVQMAVRAVEEKHWRGEGATALLCAGGAQGRQAVAGYRPGGESFQLRSQGWYAQQDSGEATRTQRCVQQELTEMRGPVRTVI